MRKYTKSINKLKMLVLPRFPLPYNRSRASTRWRKPTESEERAHGEGEAINGATAKKQRKRLLFAGTPRSIPEGQCRLGWEATTRETVSVARSIAGARYVSKCRWNSGSVDVVDYDDERRKEQQKTRHIVNRAQGRRQRRSSSLGHEIMMKKNYNGI